MLIVTFSSFAQKVSVPSLFENKTDESFLLFLQSRDNPIIYDDSLDISSPQLKASSGEIFVYQLAVCAKDSIKDVKLSFSPLNSETSSVDKSVCYNMSGVDIMGRPFEKSVSIPSGHLQALWIGVDLDGVNPGRYSGNISVTADGEVKTIPVVIDVDGNVVENHGYDEGWRLSRLSWLNSTVGHNDSVTRGYLPVERNGRTLSILGRRVTLSDAGLPASIETFFTSSNQSLKEDSEPILSSQMEFVIETESGIEYLKPSKITFTKQTPSSVFWTLTSKSHNFILETSAVMEYDGFIRYEMVLTAQRPVEIRNISLNTPVTEAKSRYLMGLGREGGLRKENLSWKWDVTKNQDMVWIGDVNGGMRLKLMDQNYRRPLVNVYYHYGELVEPVSWSNSGNGGIDISSRDNDVLLSAYSGKRTMQKEDKLHFNFELLLTPFRTVDRHKMFSDRYFHGGGPDDNARVSKAEAIGANVINVHHAGSLYPFINYPYLDANLSELKGIINDAHTHGMRMKFYYTTRELTKNIPEFWAFNSLNGEIIFPGPGNDAKSVVNPSGPDLWLIQYLRKNYIAAWRNMIDLGLFKGEMDLSVVTAPDSRLNNFYIAGLDFMVRKMNLDGVYIDDSALDRYTLRRARKVIDACRPEGRMDLHSWNHLCDPAGQASCLNMYMDLLPYFDLCWIGEGRDYNHPADNWLVEVSGIPFGLSGQMLQDGGNAARGMVYGITNRAGWSGPDVSRFWKLWDTYDFESLEMIGYWDSDSPVSSDNPDVKATFYRGDKYSVISLAAWGDVEQTVNLSLSMPCTRAYMPEIKDFQPSCEVDLTQPLKIPVGGGYIIVVEHEK